MKIGVKNVKFGIYEVVYDRLSDLSEFINVPIDTIINNCLFDGINSHWGMINDYVKAFESVNFEEYTGKKFEDYKFPLISAILDVVAEDIFSTDKNLRLLDKEIREEEVFPDFSSIEEEFHFKKLYYKFIERYNSILGDVLCDEIPVDLKLVKERFCTIMKIKAPQFSLTPIERLEELNNLADSELINAIQTINGDILREQLKKTKIK